MDTKKKFLFAALIFLFGIGLVFLLKPQGLSPDWGQGQAPLPEERFSSEAPLPEGVELPSWQISDLPEPGDLPTSTPSPQARRRSFKEDPLVPPAKALKELEKEEAVFY